MFLSATGSDIKFYGDVNASSSVHLFAAHDGSITQSGSNRRINAGKLFVSSQSGLINLYTNVNEVSGSTTGNIIIVEDNGLAIGTGGLKGNFINLLVHHDNLTLKGVVDGNIVAMITDHGSIYDGNGDANNVIVRQAGFFGSSGVIGLIGDPLDIRVLNGSHQFLVAGSRTDGHSIVMNGTIGNTNQFFLLNFPPGDFIWNGVKLYPVANSNINLSNGNIFQSLADNSNGDNSLTQYSQLLTNYIIDHTPPPPGFNLLLLEEDNGDGGVNFLLMDAGNGNCTPSDQASGNCATQGDQQSPSDGQGPSEEQVPSDEQPQ